MLKQKSSWALLAVALALTLTLFLPLTIRSVRADHLQAPSLEWGPGENNTNIIRALFPGSDSAVPFQFDQATGVYREVSTAGFSNPLSGDSCTAEIRGITPPATSDTPVQGELVVTSQSAAGGPCSSTHQTFGNLAVGASTIDDTDPTDPAAEEAVPTCTSQGGGLSWIACPLIEGMLGALIGITNFMSEILNIRPISATEADPLYVVWSNVRNIALAALVIATIIAVFGQTLGVDAYTVKKMVPRIGIAAILILMSYFISALLIDFFNVLGNGVQDLMFSTLGDMPISVGLGSEVMGGIVAAIGVGGAAVLILNPATLATLGLILLPVVMAFVTAIAVVVLRQVVIIGLVVGSPLAFAAWILPTTEKWFKRWYSIFSTMLMMYPLIMILLGAGAMYAVIITNNGSLNDGSGITSSNFANYILALVGIGVSMAAIPFTLRASSGILKGITGAINNPNRGFIDRARKGMQGTRQRNMEQRKQDRLAGLRDGKTTSGKDFKKVSPTRALYRATTGTMGKLTGGGKYAELNREQKEGEALSTDQQMARADVKKQRIPLEDLRVELEGQKVEIQMQGLKDQQRSQEIGSVMASYANPQPIDPHNPNSEKRPPLSVSELETIATDGNASDIQRIGATLRLTQMRQDGPVGEALKSMPGWMAADTVNRDYGTFNDFAPHLTEYAKGATQPGEAPADTDLAKKVLSKGYHQVGGMGAEATKVVAAGAGGEGLTQLASRYVEAYDKNQQLSPDGVKAVHEAISTRSDVPESIKHRIEEIHTGVAPTPSSTTTNTTQNTNTTNTNTNTVNTTTAQQAAPAQPAGPTQPQAPAPGTLYVANSSGAVTGQRNVPPAPETNPAPDQDNQPPTNPTP